ncbi:small G protein signaling modulator 2-like [Sycon ciliatum]|uniref:small G protein signaling modulator 2-like n=1 Tax=Sycon ciliatum TaxID=27933 RepID=UPI0031F6ADDC|eukprot:scpid40180/ scgid6497/ Small G protein signaling modulator 1; RUN and TBC1 domain-containing protein 2
MNAEKHLVAVKQAVKRLVEEAVTRRFIHQDSANITALCVALDKAITFGLQSKFKRRWSTVTSADVLQHLGRFDKAALDLSKKAQEIIAIVGQHTSSSSGGFFFSSRSVTNGGDRGGLRQKLFATYSSALNHRGHERFLWVRIALLEKTLNLIVEQLVKHSSALYENTSLIGDPVRGPIVATLLAGPCALDYSRMKTPDHLFTDPSAEELVLKDRIATRSEGAVSATQHSLEKNCAAPRSESPTPRDSEHGETLQAIATLHQNSQATLIYGKNNVLLETAPSHHARGYLSVHQMETNLLLKWTPNELVTGKGTNAAHSPGHSSFGALTVNLNQVVCVHCHPYVASAEHEEDEVDVQRIQFILQDGTSLPPIGLQHGSTLFTFLAMLETSLLPNVRLDPPLWGQHESRAGPFAPPWPVSKQRSMPSFMGLQAPVDGDSPSKTQSPSSLVNRRIDMSDLPNSLAGARQFNARQRLERGCVFHLLPTGREPSPPASPPPVELFLHLSKDDANPQQANDSSEDPDTVRQRSSTLPESPSSAHSQLPTLEQQSKCSPSAHRSISNLNRMVTARMQERIKSRTFYGWMMYCRDMRIVRNNLGKLLLPVTDSNRTVHVSKSSMDQWGSGLTSQLWEELMTNDGVIGNPHAVMKYIFFGGIQDDKAGSLRKQVWPYLLGLYSVDSTPTQRTLALDKLRKHYEDTLRDWVMVESCLKETTADELAQCEQLFADLPSRTQQLQAMWEYRESQRKQKSNRTDGNASSSGGKSSTAGARQTTHASPCTPPSRTPTPSASKRSASNERSKATTAPGGTAVLDLSDKSDDCCTCKLEEAAAAEYNNDVQVGQTVNGSGGSNSTAGEDGVGSTVITYRRCPVCGKSQQQQRSENHQVTNGVASTDDDDDEEEKRSTSKKQSTTSKTSYHVDPDHEELEPSEIWSRELHKIDKDVMRCDRNYHYFVPANLVKLRNVIATYVWEHRPPLEQGYTQGMVDLLAPLMVIFNDEVMAYGCFCKFMAVMGDNFPHGKAMDSNFYNMRLLFEVYDRELFELMKNNGDYTHFFFAYRWFLLDLKRELVYDDIFKCWECIWAARQCCSESFTLFLCASLVHTYRDIILKNNMDFTEIIKFFNDMAEKHRLDEVLDGARGIVEYLQKLLLNESKDASRVTSSSSHGSSSQSKSSASSMSTELLTP